jgi:hypothetical protein
MKGKENIHSPSARLQQLSASASCTDTIWLTPLSTIVTPESQSMRAMAMGLWVVVTKRVCERLGISSSGS